MAQTLEPFSVSPWSWREASRFPKKTICNTENELDQCGWTTGPVKNYVCSNSSLGAAVNFAVGLLEATGLDSFHVQAKPFGKSNFARPWPANKLLISNLYNDQWSFCMDVATNQPWIVCSIQCASTPEPNCFHREIYSMSAKPLLKALRLRGGFAAPAAREALPAAALGAPPAAPDALHSARVGCVWDCLGMFHVRIARESWILMIGVVKCCKLFPTKSKMNVFICWRKSKEWFKNRILLKIWFCWPIKYEANTSPALLHLLLILQRRSRASLWRPTYQDLGLFQGGSPWTAQILHGSD